MGKRLKKLFIGLSVLLVLACCAFVVSCKTESGKAGVDGKNGVDGKDGANAVISVSDDGYILIDGEKTEYCFAKEDCKIKINVENDKFGKVYGEGSYRYGSAVMLTAEPLSNGVFVDWKDEFGNVVGTKKELLTVADVGETQLTARFACAPSCVTATINVRFDKSTLPNAAYTGAAETLLTDGVTMKFEGYGENSLVLYAVDKQTFEKSDDEIAAILSDGKFGKGEKTAYEQFVSLYDESDVYETDSVELYYYIIGQPNKRYSVTIESSDESGKVTVSGGDELSAAQGYLAGTVLVLRATSERKEVNGNMYETAEFKGWKTDGKIISVGNELVYTVSGKAEIVAVFAPKTRHTITIENGEAGFTAARYKELEIPYKAEIDINGKSFETNLDFIGGVATVELGYFAEGEVFTLQLKLYAAAKTSAFNSENVWKYIWLTYDCNGEKAGEGNSLTFFVLGGNSRHADIGAKYVRMPNFYTAATDEKGNSSKEFLFSSGYGLVD